jgi:hypothetical protein
LRELAMITEGCAEAAALGRLDLKVHDVTSA